MLERPGHTTATPQGAARSNLIAITVLAATAALGMAAAGCGSSSKHSASTATTPAPSKAQFVAQANAICAQGGARLLAAQKALERVVGNHAPTPAQVTAYVNGVFAPVIQGQIDAIKALGAPTGEQATVTNMLTVAQTDLNTVKSSPAKLTQHSFANFAALAHPYGLVACARKAG